MAKKLTKKKTSIQKVVKKAPKPMTKATASQNAQGSAAVAVNLPKGEYTEGIGRRKVATARVRIYPGQGDMIVNGQAIGQYFGGLLNAPVFYSKPFELTGTKGQYALSAKVSGSGLAAQLDAVVHGIARALVKANGEYRTLLKQAGLLTRDDRMKESRKIGMGGKARRQRQSPRR